MHFDISGDRKTWKAVALRDIKAGDVLEFFYPSTEWNMAQPFDCSCGAKVCLKRTFMLLSNPRSWQSCLQRISGAKYIPADTLAKYTVNDHIKRLKAQQAQ